MMEDEKYQEAMQEILKRDSRYLPAAYEFINEAVTYTVRKMNRTEQPRGNRHVSGQELVQGIMEFAAEQFGMLAGQVLRNWGVQDGADVGAIVYNMIRVGILTASPEDRIEDFYGIAHIPDLLEQAYRTNGDPLPPGNAVGPKIF